MDHPIRLNSLLRRLLPILAVGLLGGCFFDTPPNVQISGIKCVAVGESDPAYAELQVDLLLENPTDEPIQLEVFSYSVRVGSKGRWSGSWSALRTLPARETVQMYVPAVLENPFSEEDAKTNWRVSGSISYKAPGRLAQILFDTGFRRPTHDFSGRGESITPPDFALETPPSSTQASLPPHQP